MSSESHLKEGRGIFEYNENAAKNDLTICLNNKVYSIYFILTGIPATSS